MSILDDKRNISQETIGDLVKNQKILSNKKLMLTNLANLIQALQECEEYIQKVVENKEAGDPEIGRLINKCMGQFNREDMDQLEQIVKSNFKDAMVTNSLCKLQKAQIHLAERINSVFSQSVSHFLPPPPKPQTN